MIAEVIFLLCALMSSICAVALARGFRKTQNKLLLWSAVCFGLLALSNIFLCIDLLMFPYANLNGPFWRDLLTAIAGSSLLWGLIWEIS